jgi:RNase P subunit RPR2
MVETEFDKRLCKECSQPLFLNKQDCMEYIEQKLKQGHIVCSCCGSPNKLDY